MSANEIVIEKLQKLLRLANSDNEHEAKLASTKASELLLKHNLSLQNVSNHERIEYIDEVAATTNRVQSHQLTVLMLVQDYFFVRAMIHRSGKRPERRSKIILMGRKENTTVGSYIYEYLSVAYPRLWNEYKTRTCCPNTAKKSYFLGLSKGIRKVLDETKMRVQQETGLMVLKDKELERYVNSKSGKTYNPPAARLDITAYNHGIQDGQKVQLRKPIETERKDSKLALEAK